MQLLTDWHTPQLPLAPYTLPRTVPDALTRLHDFMNDSAILGCYAHFFPKEWAASTSAQTPPPDRAYSAAEWEFFRLVDRDLFDLTLEWLEELDCQGPESRTLELPLVRGGLDWWECHPGDLRDGWELLLLLNGDWPLTAEEDEEDEDDESDEDAETATDGTDRPAAVAARVRALAGHPLDGTRLTAACAGLDSPLHGLPAAIRMIDHDSGTAWLDAEPEQEMDLRWTITDVTWMQTDYAAGRVIGDLAEQLVEWLELPAHRDRLLDLWTACLAPPADTP